MRCPDQALNLWSQSTSRGSAGGRQKLPGFFVSRQEVEEEASHLGTFILPTYGPSPCLPTRESNIQSFNRKTGERGARERRGVEVWRDTGMGKRQPSLEGKLEKSKSKFPTQLFPFLLPFRKPGEAGREGPR